MKVLFINSPTQIYEHTRAERYDVIPPIGLGYLATVAAQFLEKENVALLDAEYLGYSMPDIISYVKKFAPDLIGINIFSPNEHVVTEMITRIKSAIPGVSICLGGVHARIAGRDLFKNPVISKSVDFICIGNGENTMRDIIHHFQGQRTDYAKISGIAYQQGGYVHVTREVPLTKADLDEEIILDHSFFDNDLRRCGDKVESFLLSSRGCPFKCEFCAAQILNRSNRVLLRSIKSIEKELEALLRQGCNYIRFVDDLLLASHDRICELTNMLERQSCNQNNFGFEANGRANIMSRLPRNLWGKLIRSGLLEIEIGIESGSPRILRTMNKKIGLDDIEKTVQMASEYGIKVKGFIMVGYPKENKSDISMTIKFMRHLKKLHSGIRFSPVPTKMYPGTLLFRRVNPTLTENALEGSICVDISHYGQGKKEKSILSGRTRYNAMHATRDGEPMALSELSGNADTQYVLESLAEMCLI